MHASATRLPPVFPAAQAAPTRVAKRITPKPSSALWRSTGHHAVGWLLGLIFPALLLGLWWLTAERHWIAEQILPPPAFVWESLCLELGSGEIWTHIGISLTRVAESLLLGGGVGLLLGLGMGLSPNLRAYLLPTIRALSQVPVLGWIPLLIIFVGIEEALKLWAVSLAVAVPVAFTTLDGIANIQRSLLEVGQVYAFNRQQVLRHIVWPATLPSLFTAFRQGVMQAWLTVIFVELLSASEGLGFFMAYNRALAQIDLVIVAMFAIGAIGILIETSLRHLETRSQPWQRSAF